MPDYNTFMLLLIAIINAGSTFMIWWMKQDIRATKIAVMQTEVNTNSMREQLVQRTGEAERAAGRDEMRIEAEKKATELLKKGG